MEQKKNESPHSGPLTTAEKKFHWMNINTWVIVGVKMEAVYQTSIPKTALT